MTTSVDTLLEITKRNLKSYGAEVVEQRAVPDYRDGLKPVHRFILWALYGLNLKSTGPFKKAARTVGDVIGRYSPHGDMATYGAMVGMAGVRSEDGKSWSSRNSAVPLVEGYGNWGDNIDGAAAQRYTEARLSKFSDFYLLDPTYLAVVDYVPNFSQDEKVPLVLPAKLPVLLLNGSVSIAFGVSAETPSFAPAGVLAAVKRCLKGETLTPAVCAKLFKFAPVYGGDCVSDPAQVLEFFKTGTGSIEFLPSIEVDEKKNTVTITSACPGLTSPASWKTLTDKLTSMKEVKSVYDSTGKSGFKFLITAERGIEPADFIDLIEKTVLRKQSFNIGITRRELDSVQFSRSTVSDIVKDWCKWRIELELRVLNYLINADQQKLLRLKLLLLACTNLKVVMDSLRKEDSALYISQQLGLTLEEANTILDLKVRQLKALEATKLRSSIKLLEQAIKSFILDMKKPEIRILKDLEQLDLQ